MGNVEGKTAITSWLTFIAWRCGTEPIISAAMPVSTEGWVNTARTASGCLNWYALYSMV